MPKAAALAAPSAALAVAMHYYFRFLGGVPESLAGGGTVWASVSTVLGVLIVFRTNQAYARYWEGATLLLQIKGEWLNATSSLIAFCSPDPAVEAQVAKFQHQLVRLTSLMYCTALQNVALVNDAAMEVIDLAGMDEQSMTFLVHSRERCDVISQWIRRLIVVSMRDGVIPVPPPILTRVFQELDRGLVDAKDMQKIAEFPFPFPYTQLIVAVLVAQSVFTPFISIVITDEPLWAAVATFTSMLALWSTNYIAVELEQPFGEDVNDLPIADMMKDMNARLKALLDEKSKAPPDFCGSLDMTRLPKVVSCADCRLLSTKRAVMGFCKARTRTSSVYPTLYGRMSRPSGDRAMDDSVRPSALRRTRSSGAQSSEYAHRTDSGDVDVEAGANGEFVVAAAPSMCRAPRGFVVLHTQAGRAAEERRDTQAMSPERSAPRRLLQGRAGSADRVVGDPAPGPPPPPRGPAAPSAPPKPPRFSTPSPAGDPTASAEAFVFRELRAPTSADGDDSESGVAGLQLQSGGAALSGEQHGPPRAVLADDVAAVARPSPEGDEQEIPHEVCRGRL